MNINKSFLNVEKTTVMTFGNYKNKEDLYIKIDHVNIENVKEIKFVGEIRENKLPHQTHTKQSSKKHFNHKKNEADVI